jgi:hypothetical protein
MELPTVGCREPQCSHRGPKRPAQRAENLIDEFGLRRVFGEDVEQMMRKSAPLLEVDTDDRVADRGNREFPAVT